MWEEKALASVQYLAGDAAFADGVSTPLCNLTVSILSYIYINRSILFPVAKIQPFKLWQDKHILCVCTNFTEISVQILFPQPIVTEPQETSFPASFRTICRRKRRIQLPFELFDARYIVSSSFSNYLMQETSYPASFRTIWCKKRRIRLPFELFDAGNVVSSSFSNYLPQDTSYPASRRAIDTYLTMIPPLFFTNKP